LIVERTLAAVATAAAVFAAVSVAVVSAFFALYALVEPMLGPAGGGAVVATVAALLATVIAMIAARGMERDKQGTQAEQGAGHSDIAGILMGVVKDRPLLSAGAAIAVGVYALRNPSLVSAVVRGFIDSRSKP